MLADRAWDADHIGFGLYNKLANAYMDAVERVEAAAAEMEEDSDG